MTGIHRRLDQLEDYFVDPDQTPDALAQRAYAALWKEAGEAIALTMSHEHLALLVADDTAPGDSPARRLRNAFHSRIVDRIGVGPGWGFPVIPDPHWPDSPLALPPVVAEAYMQADPFAAQPVFVSEGKVCGDCGYMVPGVQRQEPVERDADGVNHWLDGELAPFIAINSKCWRTVSSIETCPLCEGPILFPSEWHHGHEFFNVALLRKRKAS